MIPTTEQLQAREEWLKALESGDHQQCKGKLTLIREDGSQGHCCLGVANTLFSSADTYPSAYLGTEKDFVYTLVYSSRDGYGEGDNLTLEVAEKIGLVVTTPIAVWAVYGDELEQVSLIRLNDTVGYSFAQIAEVVRGQGPGWDGHPSTSALFEEYRQQPSSSWV